MLELAHVTKTYKTSKGIQTHALQDVSLKFPQKGMVFILGKSGSGKSTLLNIIGGLDQADSGEVILHGKSSNTFTKSDYDVYRNTYIGFIFQEFNLIDEYTIEKNIALALQLQQKRPDHEEIEAMLAKVGLSGYGSRYPNELSGGQKQRVAIARSLIKSPQILLADEPTGALDSATGTEIFTTLKELAQEKLVIVVSHDEESAHRYADRIIRFADGRVIENTNSEVAEDDETFVPIRSHLPFKDSFHLGITCLRHKKLRMIFTILLTSFALLTLSLSDSIGNFNDVDVQYKAMQDHDMDIVGIRRQIMDEDGNTYIHWQENLLAINKAAAVSLLNELDGKVAKVYDSQDYALNLSHLGIFSTNASVYEEACTRYRLTELGSFDDLGIKEVIGTFPQTNQEAAISSYLADQILNNGISDKNGGLTHFTSYEEIIQKATLNIADHPIRITAIVPHDLSAYDELKQCTMSQMSEKDYSLYRSFRNIVNQNCEQIMVKEGFVKALALPKSTVLYSPSGWIQFYTGDGKQDGDQGQGEISYTYDGANATVNTATRSVYPVSLTYPQEEITYYDGKTLQSCTHLNNNEVIWSMRTLADYLGNEEIYQAEFIAKSDSEKNAYYKRMADQVVGKKVKLFYNDVSTMYRPLLDQEVLIKGVILSNDDIQNWSEENNDYAAKELIEPLINDPFYIGELLMHKEGSDLYHLLKQYSLSQEYAAHTIATDDVYSVEGFADFATKAFFIASIAFFCFAGALMMNFIVVSIAYRKKEIGILRSIGARSLDVIKIFVWETVLLALISYIITVVTMYGLASIINTFAMDSIGMLISPVIITWRQPLLLLSIVIVISCMASLLPILRIGRQRPIDAIKK